MNENENPEPQQSADRAPPPMSRPSQWTAEQQEAARVLHQQRRAEKVLGMCLHRWYPSRQGASR